MHSILLKSSSLTVELKKSFEGILNILIIKFLLAVAKNCSFGLRAKVDISSFS
jgi:hypothetical protein